MGKSLGVGLIGVSPPDSWAVVAHIPALRALEGRYHIAGIANSSHQSGQEAARACGIGTAFESVDALCASEAVDVIAITVRAALHGPMVEKALAAGKNIYCEWPLGPSYEETARLAKLAGGSDRIHVCGSQALAHPTIRYVADLIRDGHVGDPLHSTIVANGGSWGGMMPQRYAYSTDERNGASLLTVPIGHTIVGIQEVFGPVATVFAERSTRRRTTRIIETGEELPLKTPDNALVGLTFESGMPLAMHCRGGVNRSRGFHWEIIGSDGELHVSGDPFGAIEMIDLTLKGAKGEEPLVDMPVPESYAVSHSQGIIPDNVQKLYAMLYDDIQSGSRSAPSFDDALRNHRIVEAIARSSDEGRRIAVSDI